MTMLRHILMTVLFLLSACTWGQELNCKVKIIHTQVQGTNTSVFETLETALNEFMNNRAWTELQFAENERIDCTMNITVKTYKPDENKFTGELLFQSSRPVYNSAYNTTVFSMKDADFSFTYLEYDPLEFNENMIDNNLTAMMAYYAYLLIGMDLDTMSPLGGTAILQKAEMVVNSAQSLSEPGWKAFDNNKNRHGIINDYLETSMEPFRRMQYKYHREGLDEMSNNVDRGRAAVTEAIAMLNEAHKNKPLSMLPQIFTDFKRDEIVNIYNGHGTPKEKEEVFNVLSELNAAQSQQWNKIKR